MVMNIFFVYLKVNEFGCPLKKKGDKFSFYKKCMFRCHQVFLVIQISKNGSQAVFFQLKINL